MGVTATRFSRAFWTITVLILVEQQARTTAEKYQQSHRRKSRSHHTKLNPVEHNNFCSTDDHRIFSIASNPAEPSRLHILSFRNKTGRQLDFLPYLDSNLKAHSDDKKVTRRELFRFQSLHTSDQWAIVSADGSYHLAVNDTGGLIVEKDGCISTTFLRVVDAPHLEECFEGLRCNMSLCATRFGANRSFLVAPMDHTRSVGVDRSVCQSYRNFRQQSMSTAAAGENWHKLTVLSASGNTRMLTRGLRQLCSETFGGKPKPGYCKN